jgi:hypothetical protein
MPTVSGQKPSGTQDRDYKGLNGEFYRKQGLAQAAGQRTWGMHLGQSSNESACGKC